MKSRLLIMAGVILLTGAMAAAQDAKLEALTGGKPALAKLNGQLLEARQAEQRGIALTRTAEQSMASAVRDGMLQVLIGSHAITDGLLNALSAQKITVVGVYPEQRTIVARCSNVSQLEAVVARDDVGLITPEPPAVTRTGAVTSQADALQHSSTVRQMYNVNGSGVKVGILSDTFHRVIGGSLVDQILTGSASQNTGDLPPTVQILDPGPTTGTDEGAGMAELVYDVAPGCSIAFASAFTSYAAFSSNITALVAAGCDVIVDDVGYYAEPKYQDGPIAVAANNAVAAGVPYFSSAGNSADDAHEGPFVDSNATNDTDWLPSGKDFHNFGGGDTHLNIVLYPGGSVIAVLHWNQPYDSDGPLGSGPGSAADLDLWLVPNTNKPLTHYNARSTSIQGTIASPSGDPVELLQYSNGTGAARRYYLVIDRYYDPPTGVSPSAMSLMVDFGGNGGYIEDSSFAGARTIFGHPSAADAMAVAAIRYDEVMAGAPYSVEYFSSLGGSLPFYFDSAGSPLPGAPQYRSKPEVTGIDGTNTSFFGSFDYDSDGWPNFFGTSASAPHVAAIAALMAAVKPGITPSEIRNAMEATAVDTESAGWDALSGFGWVDALGAVEQVVVEFSGPPAEYTYALEGDGDVTVTDSIPARDGVVTLPGETPTARFSGIYYNLLVGTDGDDILIGVGTVEDDAMGLNNKDLILGLGGNDTLRGINGDDVLIGGPGNDKLYGDNGNDILIGGSGNDTLYPGAGDDFVGGGSGNDLVVMANPTNPNITVSGGEGTGDKLLLANGYGSFTMTGCQGFEKFAGGDGNDNVDWSNATVPVEMRGNAGNDTLTGGSASDILRGGPGNDVLIGGDGNDVLYGENGDDDLRGGAGADVLYTGAGADTADGGEGDNDKVVLGTPDGASDHVEGGAGNGDKLVLENGYGTFVMDALHGFEEFVGGDGSDVIDWSAATAPVTLRGNGGDDTLKGGSGADLLTGGDGNDALYGGGGADVLYGDGGINHLIGGGGNDGIRGGGSDFAHFSASPAPPRYTVRDAGSYIAVTDTSGVDGQDIVRGCPLANLKGPYTP